MRLVVKNPFSGYKKGDVITDPVIIEKILANEHQIHVIKARPVDEKFNKPMVFPHKAEVTPTIAATGTIASSGTMG